MSILYPPDEQPLERTGTTLDNGHGPPIPPPPTDEDDPAAPTSPRVPGARPGKVGHLVVRKASDVTPIRVRWLWAARIAYAKLNVLGGPPGVGKSYLTDAIAAAVSTGRGLPGDERGDQAPARVLMLSYEDDAEDTTVPRLTLLGADLERVELVEGVATDDNGRRRAFGPEDVATLAALVAERGDVALVVVDPVSAFVGAGTDEHRANEVRAALEDLRILAQEHASPS